MITEKYCILDIESHTVGDKPNPEVDELRYVGFKSCTGNYRIYHYTEIDPIKQALNAFPYYIGHNLKEFDIPILNRYGMFTSKDAVIVDTYEIALNRMKPMMYIDTSPGDLKLGALLKRFKSIVSKGEFDYDLLEKDKLDGQELEDLIKYLKLDLDGAEEIFKYFYDLFVGFRELVNDRNRKNMSWLTSKSGTASYKILTCLADLPEDYDNDVEENEDSFQGGFVLQPKTEFVEGNIHYRDATSLYPHVYMLGNLFSPVPKGHGWNGAGMYPNIYANEVDGVRGTYSPTPGKMENIFKFLFTERAKLNAEKKKYPKDSPEYIEYDRKQLPLKICMNSAYGICGNPKFKSVYNLTTAMDCTAMARRTTKHAITVLEEYGYQIIYGDTDSIIVLDPFNNDKKLEDVFNYIKNRQIESANIKVETHGFKLECKVKRIYFFKNDKDEFNKKNYIYVTDKDEIVEKGIRIVRGDCSPLAKMVYEKYIKPLALNSKPMKLSVETISDWIKIEANNNPDLLKKRYRLRSVEGYKIPEGKEESPCLHAQLAKKYGPGEFYFVVNKRIGPGKGNHYCTLEELQKKYDAGWLDQIKLDMYLRDLKCFVKDEERKLVK